MSDDPFDDNPEPPLTPRQVVEEQAKDNGLWFIARHATEAYLQQELRRLHAAVEAQEPVRNEAWESAVNSAAYQYEIYVHQGKTATPEERRVALSDALSHAVGIIRLREAHRERAAAPDAPAMPMTSIDTSAVPRTCIKCGLVITGTATYLGDNARGYTVPRSGPYHPSCLEATPSAPALEQWDAEKWLRAFYDANPSADFKGALEAAYDAGQRSRSRS